MDSIVLWGLLESDLKKQDENIGWWMSQIEWQLVCFPLSCKARGYWTFPWDLEVSWDIFGNRSFVHLAEPGILIWEDQINIDVDFRTVCGKTKWMILASSFCTYDMCQWREWG